MERGKGDFGSRGAAEAQLSTLGDRGSYVLL